MKSVIKQAALAAFLASVGVLAVSQSRPVHAADKAQAKSPVMRKEVGAPFNDAVKLFLAKDFAGAKVKAELADMVPMKTPYEEYSVAKLLGTIALNQAMPDYATATTDWERMIASGGAPDMDKGAMYTTAMKLHYQAMQYPKAIADATEVQKIQPLDDGGYRILANSYYSANDFPNTIQTAKAANAAKVAAGMAPSEDILRMELSAQHKLMDDAGHLPDAGSTCHGIAANGRVGRGDRLCVQYQGHYRSSGSQSLSSELGGRGHERRRLQSDGQRRFDQWPAGGGEKLSSPRVMCTRRIDESGPTSLLAKDQSVASWARRGSRQAEER